MLKHLPREELGLWYVYVSLGSFAALTSQVGFCQAILRGAGHLKAGATQILAFGLEDNPASGSPNWAGLLSLRRVGIRLFALISGLSFVVLALAGSAWIYTTYTTLPNLRLACASWVVYAAGVAVGIYASFFIAFMQGVGDMKYSLRFQTLARTTNLLLVAILLLRGWGLVAMAMGSLLSSSILLLGSAIRLNEVLHAEGSDASAGSPLSSALRTIWPNTWRFTVVAVGGWMIVSSGTLICSRYLGLSEAARYGLTLQFVQLCIAIAAVWTTVVMPRLNQLRAIADFASCRRLFVQRLVLATFTFWILTLLGLVLAPIVLDRLHAHTRLLPTGPLLFMALYLFLEFNHSFFAGLIMAENRVPFVPAALASGAAIVIGSTLLAAHTSLGIWSILLVQAVVQLSFNNWYWVYRGLQILRVTRREFVRHAVDESWNMLARFPHIHSA
jgi:O-antigen/teichoic acid export membrane protein